MMERKKYYYLRKHLVKIPFEMQTYESAPLSQIASIEEGRKLAEEDTDCDYYAISEIEIIVMDGKEFKTELQKVEAGIFGMVMPFIEFSKWIHDLDDSSETGKINGDSMHFFVEMMALCKDDSTKGDVVITRRATVEPAKDFSRIVEAKPLLTQYE